MPDSSFGKKIARPRGEHRLGERDGQSSPVQMILIWYHYTMLENACQEVFDTDQMICEKKTDAYCPHFSPPTI
jgi:hypothetical protein